MKKNYMRLAGALLLFVYSVSGAYAQSWKWGLCNSASAAGDAFGGFSATDLDNNVYVSTWMRFGSIFEIGAYSIASAYDQQGVLFKTDSMHNVLWAIGPQSSESFIGRIATGNSGNVYAIITSSDTTITFGTVTCHSDSGIIQQYLAKVSATGSVLWMKKLASDSYPDHYIAVDKYDNIYVGCAFNRNIDTIGSFVLHNTTGPDTADIYIAKFDSSGSCLWARSYGGSSGELTRSMKVSPDGNIYYVASTLSPSISIGPFTVTNSHPLYGTCFIARFDSNGTPVWVHPIDTNKLVLDLDVSQNENVYIGGRTADPGLGIAHDTLGSGFVRKYDSLGNIIWERQLLNGVTFSLAVDSHEFIWASGEMFDVMSFDGESIGIPGVDQRALYLAGFDHDGHYLPHTATKLKSTNDNSYSIAADHHNNIYFPTYFNDTVTIASSSMPIGTLPPSGDGFYFYLARYSYGDMLSTTGIALLPADHNIVVYPNPVTNALTISSSDGITSIAITDVAGHIINSRIYDSKQVQVDVSTLSPGMYFIRINGTDVRKFIKE